MRDRGDSGLAIASGSVEEGLGGPLELRVSLVMASYKGTTGW